MGYNTYIYILYYTILYYTILYYTIPYYTILYHTILYYTILILYYTNTILYYTILYYTILYYTILYYTILYYTTIIIYTVTRNGIFVASSPPHTAPLTKHPRHFRARGQNIDAYGRDFTPRRTLSMLRNGGISFKGAAYTIW